MGSTEAQRQKFYSEAQGTMLKPAMKQQIASPGVFVQHLARFEVMNGQDRELTSSVEVSSTSEREPGKRSGNTFATSSGRFKTALSVV